MRGLKGTRIQKQGFLRIVALQDIEVRVSFMQLVAAFARSPQLNTPPSSRQPPSTNR
jgi:hypothetical protein